METNRDGIMRKETKRFYDFTFEQLTKALKLEGKFVAYGTKDDKGKETQNIKIITIVVDEVPK